MRQAHKVMLERILSLVKKEMILILRDKRLRFVVLGVPMLQLLVFGYAAIIDVKHISTAICDRDCTPASRELISSFAASDYFTIAYYESNESRLRYLLESERIIAIIEIPSGFARELDRGHTAPVRIVADGTNTVAATVVSNYASAIVQSFGLNYLKARGRLPLSPTVLQMEQRAIYNPAMENRYFYIPGIMAMIIILLGMSLTSMAIVQEKEQGTLEQIIVTPITSIDLIIGKTLPYTIMVLLAISFQLVLSRFWFGVPFRGNLLVLYLGILLFLLVALGYGIFISTVSQTQQQALLGGFFILMPSILLSGFMFPIANMPEAIQWLTYLNPMRYILVTLRTIFLKGNGLDVLWPDYTILLVMGLAIFSLSALRFRKRLN